MYTCTLPDQIANIFSEFQAHLTEEIEYAFSYNTQNIFIGENWCTTSIGQTPIIGDIQTNKTILRCK